MPEPFKEGEGDDEHRHRCLVRYIIRWRIEDRDAVHRWLRGYTNPAGRWIKGWNELHEGSILERDVREQWRRGSKGEDQKWLS